ncbi:hypothetical protein ACFSKM_01280 [Ancylobacter dichloromethanicus]
MPGFGAVMKVAMALFQAASPTHAWRALSAKNLNMAFAQGHEEQHAGTMFVVGQDPCRKLTTGQADTVLALDPARHEQQT